MPTLNGDEDGPPVRGYMAERLPASRRAVLLSRISQPISMLEGPRVVLIAWGINPANCFAATERGRKHAEECGYRILHRVASYSPLMRDAILFGATAAGWERREVDYGAGWWLVHHSSVNPRDLEAAHVEQMRRGALKEEDAFRAEYGYPPDAVRLSRDEGPPRPPFPKESRVEDSRTGAVAAPERMRPRPLRLPPTRRDAGS
jgi:hypothetical protein